MSNNITPDSEFEAMGAVPASDSEFEALGAVAVEPEATLPPEISKMESAGRGIQQGATLGFGDEFSGAVEGGADLVQQALNKLGLAGPSVTQVNQQLASEGTKGDLGPQGLLDLYRQGRDSNRLENKQAQEANPMSYLGGNIAGGALTAMAAPQALMNPMGSAPAGASILQKIGQGALNAAPAGAAIGLGMSEAPTVGGDIISTAKGMGEGMALGGAMPLIAEPVKAAARTVKNSKMAQDMLDAYRAGIQKIDLHTPEFLKNARDQLKSMASEADDAIRQKTAQIFKDKSNVLDELEQTGIRSDAKEALQGLANDQGSSTLLKPDESKMIQDTVKKIMTDKGMVQSPRQLEGTIQELKALKGSVSGEGMKMVDRAVKRLEAVQNTLDPRIQKLNNEAFQVIDSGETLLKKGPLDYNDANTQMSVQERLANVLENSNKYKSESFLDDVLNKGLETSKNAKISPMSQTVPDAAKALTGAKDIARNMDLAKGMQGPSFSGSNVVNSAANAIKTSGTGLANKAGQAVQKNQEFLQKGVKALADATPEQINQLSSTLMQKGTPIAKEYARVLSEAAGKNNVSRNAIMFGLMQQPQFRELFESKPMVEESGNTNESGN